MNAKNKKKFIDWLKQKYFSDESTTTQERVKKDVYKKLQEYDFEKPKSDPNQTHIFYE